MVSPSRVLHSVKRGSPEQALTSRTVAMRHSQVRVNVAEEPPFGMLTLCRISSIVASRGALTAVKTRQARILVVDDEPTVLDLLRELLTAKGYDVMAVSTGAAALAAVPKFLPHVLLVDISMPGLSGPQVLEALRGSGSKIPVIAMSGLVTGPTDGFFAFLGKPFDHPRLLRTIESAMGRDGH
jgi:two-component system, OmpR family, response regulator